MAYTDFTLETIEEKFGIKNREIRLFGSIGSIEPSAKLKDDLEEANTYPLRTEKAKSELLVMPVLKEIRRLSSRYFTIYSGEVLNADVVNGLNGECDFILAKDIGSYSINYPILQLVEAKKNDVDLGIPQCAAQMVGAKVFNQKKGVEPEVIYGCVTTGDEWLFMRLDKDIEIDTQTYYLNQLPEILGVFQHIIEYYKAVLK